MIDDRTPHSSGDAAKTADERLPSSVGVKDLIEHRLFIVPTTVVGTHSGKTIEAILLPDGTFVCDGAAYQSASAAAGRSITAAVGVSSPRRKYFSVNGWKFWHVQCADGTSRSLSDLRDQFLRRAP